MSELSASVRLAVFGAALLAVFAIAIGVGRATGDLAQAAPAPGAQQEEHGGEHRGSAASTAVTGTSLSAGGLRLDVPSAVLPAGAATPFRFRVVGEHGPVTAYDVEQGKRMHLVVVSRDLSRHAHLHPQLGSDGTWTTPLTLAPGSYRAVADFAVDGERHSLAVDLTAPGLLAPVPLPAPASSATVQDLRVDLARTGSTLSFTAYDRSGRAVVPEPYLGARGHLVAFRAGDLAYAHVHPAGEDGATTDYEAELPGPGTYRLFLELQVGGTVRTFPFTLEVAA